MILLGYIGAVATGISLGLVGGGGSILIVPVLVYLFKIPPALATAYSLFVVGLASLVGVGRYAALKLIDYRAAVIFALPSFMGVFAARRFIVTALPEPILQWGSFTLSKGGLIMTVFALVMLFASFSMIWRKPVPNRSAGADTTTPRFNYLMIGLQGFGVGVVTGFVGAGGGFLIIPALVLFARLPMKLAVGTSLVIIAAKSLLGFLGDIGADRAVDWGLLSTISAASIVGIFIGTYISKFVSGKRLQPAFGWFVLVMGVIIMIRQYI